MSEQHGVIYIMTNPSFREYVKIGYADNIDVRLKQLNRSECTPFAFRVYATYEVNTRLTDMRLHDMIDKINPTLRAIDNVNGKKRVREFYAMSAEDAYSLFEAMAEIHGTQEKLKLYKPTEQQKEQHGEVQVGVAQEFHVVRRMMLRLERKFVAEAVDSLYFCLCSGGLHLLAQVFNLRIDEIEAVGLVDVVSPYRFGQCRAVDESVGIAHEVV